MISIDRRRLIIAAALLAGSAEGLRLSRAWAQTSAQADPALQGAVGQMLRRLYPHERLADSVYSSIFNDLVDSGSADPQFAEVLDQAENALNGGQPGDFADLDEAGQIAAMRALEQTEFFGAIQGALRLRLYNHPALWQLIGYEGSSWQFGGYVNRGAGEIDWLEETD